MEELVEESVVLEPHQLRFREIILRESEVGRRLKGKQERRERGGEGHFIYFDFLVDLTRMIFTGLMSSE